MSGAEGEGVLGEAMVGRVGGVMGRSVPKRLSVEVYYCHCMLSIGACRAGV